MNPVPQSSLPFLPQFTLEHADAGQIVDLDRVDLDRVDLDRVRPEHPDSGHCDSGHCDSGQQVPDPPPSIAPLVAGPDALRLEASVAERKGAAVSHVTRPADAPLPIEVLLPPVATARPRRRPGRPRRPLFGAEAGPRARLFRKGPAELTETELLALLFGTGSRGFPAPTLAEALLTSRGLGGLAAASWQDLCAERGIGPVRAAQVLAGFELGRRCFRGEESREFIRGPEDIYTATADLREARKEHFLTFYLNARHQVITRETVSIG